MKVHLESVSVLQREAQKKRREGVQKMKADKQAVLDMLFSAFEKRQYYSIKQLVDLTNQPVVRARGTIGPNEPEHLIISAFSFLISSALSEENSKRHRNVPNQRRSQVHLGAQARISMLRWKHLRPYRAP